MIIIKKIHKLILVFFVSLILATISITSVLSSTRVCGSRDMERGPVKNWVDCRATSINPQNCSEGFIIFDCDRYKRLSAEHIKIPPASMVGIQVPDELMAHILCRVSGCRDNASLGDPFGEILSLIAEMQNVIPPRAQEDSTSFELQISNIVGESSNILAGILLSGPNNFSPSLELMQMSEAITGYQSCPGNFQDIVRIIGNFVNYAQYGINSPQYSQLNSWLNVLTRDLDNFANLETSDSNVRLLIDRFKTSMGRIEAAMRDQEIVEEQSQEVSNLTEYAEELDVNDEVSNCLSNIIENSMGPSLPEIDQKILFFALFRGEHQVPINQIGALLESCLSSEGNNRFLHCVLERAGYENIDENINWSRNHQIVSLQLNSRDLELINEALAMAPSIFNPNSQLHATELIVPGPDGPFAFFGNATLNASLAQIAQSTTNQLSQRNPQCTTTTGGDEILERAGNYTASTVALHELGHAVWFRLVNRGYRPGGPILAERNRRWVSISWENSSTPGPLTQRLISPIPVDCSRRDTRRGLAACAGIETIDQGYYSPQERAARNAGFASHYGSTNDGEDFAEMFVQYFTGKYPIPITEEGKSIWRRKFQFIQEITGIPRPENLPSP